MADAEFSMDEDKSRFIGIRCVFLEIIKPLFFKILANIIVTSGFKSLTCFLNDSKIKHKMFHLRNKNNCCQDFDNCVNKHTLSLGYAEWELLYHKPLPSGHHCYCQFQANPIGLERLDFNLLGLILLKCCDLKLCDNNAVRGIRQFYKNHIKYNAKQRIKEDELNTVWTDLVSCVLDLDRSKEIELVSIMNRPSRKKKIYRMESVPRGLAVIINIKKGRKGAEKDQEKLSEMLIYLIFNKSAIFNTYEDITAEEIEKTLMAFSKSDLLNTVDCLLVVIMSHGNSEIILGSDGSAVKVNDLISLFNTERCPAMTGKPKMFVVNACRSELSDVNETEASLIHFGSTMPVPDGFLQLDGPTNCILLPHMCDFVIAYSTFQGYESYRDEEKGTWFIQCLTDVFKEMSSEEHVLDMLIEVNDRVTKMSDNNVGYMQVPAPIASLRYKWFLNPPTL